MEITKPKVKIISNTGVPYDVVSVAAKTCYSSMDLDDLMKSLTDSERIKLIKTLEDSKHESPFEHVSITFAISNISRACSHQLVRHRIASFSQRSQRYVDETGFNYFVPVNINSSKNIKEYYTCFMNKVGVIYEELKEDLLNYFIEEYRKVQNKEPDATHVRAFKKWAGEEARYVLPNACITQLVMTMNIRSLWNFFNLRCCNRAQSEINELAWEMLRQCRSRWSLLFKHAGPDCMNGTCKEKPGFSCGRPPYEKIVELRELDPETRS